MVLMLHDTTQVLSLKKESKIKKISYTIEKILLLLQMLLVWVLIKAMCDMFSTTICQPVWRPTIRRQDEPVEMGINQNVCFSIPLKMSGYSNF